MINIDKSTQNFNLAQIAGLHIADKNSEFVGVTTSQEVVWVSKGQNIAWKNLPKWLYNLCQKKFLSDHVAIEQLGKLPISQDRQIELFIYHSYGCVNSTADIIDGQLQPSENFRHTKNTASLNWTTKDMTINGVVLNERDLFIIDCYKEDLPDKMIAYQLEITESTLNFHKRNLMQKIGAQSKMGVLVEALKNDI